MPGTNRSGRRPQPSAVRMLKGSKTRAHHRGEPEYLKAIPAMPSFIAIDPVASTRWQSLAPRIAQAGVLTEAHGEMLSLLCSSWADLERAREQFAQMGYQQLVVDEVMTNGERRRKVKANPLIIRIEKLAYQVARFLGEFGLTPMTSAKVSGERAVEGIDPFAEFLEDDGNIYNTQRTQ